MSAGSLGQKTKDPDEVLDYSIDWTDVLAAAETVSSATWTTPTGLTEGVKTVASPLTTVWLSGGTVGTTYTVGCKIVTSGARTFDRSFALRIENK